MESAVSIVIPTLNRGPLLVEAVRSGVELGPRAEVIVADGGSSDGSLALLEQFGDAVTVTRGSFPNAAATRNAGAVASRAPYLAFLDSDDIALPARISCLQPVLDHEPGVALVHGRTEVIDAEGRPNPAMTSAHERAFREAERLGTTYDALAGHCAMFTSATLVRRSAFEEVGGYDEALEVYEDWDLYLRLALRWRLVYERCVVARYRIWSGNVTWDRTAEGTVRVAEKHLAAPPDLPEPTLRRARYHFLRRIAASQHILVHRREAQRAALAALRLRPGAALTDSDVRGPLLRSFLPASVLRSRRPARGRVP
jgi:GT2 family glycosyltransferase